MEPDVTSLEELKHEVEKLKEALRPRRHWYRRAANWISIAALVVSTSAAVYLSRRDDQRTKLDLARNTANEILQVRADDLRDQYAPLTPATNSVRTLRQMRISLLLEKLTSLSNELGDSAGPALFVALGMESLTISNYLAAERYIRKALVLLPDLSREKSAAELSLAAVYLTPGSPLHNIENGHQHIDAALRNDQSLQGDEGHSIRGQTFVNVANIEYMTGEVEAARRFRDQAKTEFDAIARNSQAKGAGNFLIDGLDKMLIVPLAPLGELPVVTPPHK